MLEQYQARYNMAMDNEALRLRLKGEGMGVSLRSHIAGVHFQASVLCWVGVPRFDIELAKSLKIPLDWVVKKGIQRLEKGWHDDPLDADLLDDIGHFSGLSKTMYDRLDVPWGEDWCKQMIVKTLRYIDQTGTARVDWNRVSAVYPGAENIELDIERDSFDPPTQS